VSDKGQAVVIDTSAWVQAFRGSDPVIKSAVDRLLEEDLAVLCGIVEMEIFQGLKEAERKRIAPLLRILKYLEVERDDWILAGQEYAHLRTQGVTLPSSDVLLAAMCIRRDLPLLTTDGHFDYFKKKLKLR